MICNANYYGTWNLFKKETLRFLKVYHQTILSPVINALLLLAIFSLAIGDRIKDINNMDFEFFMAPGLIIMAAMQNAFANTSSSFVMGKVLGHIIDYLIPPIGSNEILIAMVTSAALRGIMVGAAAFAAIYIFVPMSFHDFFHALFCLICATIFLGLLGMLCGIISESFDHMSAITSYLITPLTFLSGTFYSINNLPEFWQKIAFCNPFFYMIDGFRYGITGYIDGTKETGIIVMLSVNIALWIIISTMLKRGYKIKN
ncbi:ABC transporter permease [Rickettsiales bacterium]|nr:ABC transporter permease [Rickettsiales bacterium]